MYNLLNTFQAMNECTFKLCSPQVNIEYNYALPEHTLSTDDSCYSLTIPLKYFITWHSTDLLSLLLKPDFTLSLPSVGAVLPLSCSQAHLN